MMLIKETRCVMSSPRSTLVLVFMHRWCLGEACARYRKTGHARRMLVLPWDTARLLGLHAHLLKPATRDGARPGPALTVDDVLITPEIAQRRFRLPDATSSGNAPSDVVSSTTV
jgi:hypothetical protein